MNTTHMGIGFALIIIAFGLMLLLRRKSPDDMYAQPPGEPVEGRMPIVGRAQRQNLTDEAGLGTALEPMPKQLAAEVQSDNRSIESLTAETVTEPLTVPSSLHSDATAHHVVLPAENTDIMPQGSVQHAATPLNGVNPAKPQATTSVAIVEPNAPAAPASHQEASLEDLLAGLEQATAQMQPPVEDAPLEAWQGESQVLNEYIDAQIERDEALPLSQAQELISWFILPTQGQTLNNKRVFELFAHYGFRYGELALFHRFAEINGEGLLQFSILRLVDGQPQAFDLENFMQERIDGLAFFLGLPHLQGVQAFDLMSSIATTLARDLNAQVYIEDQKTPISWQLREDYRHTIAQFRPR